MSRGYLVQCVPLAARDRVNGQAGVAAPVGMDFTGEVDRAPAPLHYLMNEQAKSLAALQELQNEVGALLEFRDLVIETFPHLRVKMASHTNSPGSSHSAGGSQIPVPLCISGRREWEPGVRVRRKLPNKETAHDTSLTSASRSRSNSHGSGSKVQTSQLLSGSGAGGSGASSAGSSAVQDSGFGTESKEHYSASSSASASAGAASASQASGNRPVNNSSEDELWNLLDVIHRKGSRLRQEVEQLQTRLQDKEVTAIDRSRGKDRRHPSTHRARSLGSAPQPSSQTSRERPLSAELEHVDNGDDSIDVDAELVASRARASHLRASHLRAEVATARRDLQELLQHEHQGVSVGGRLAAVQVVSPAGSSQLLRPTACFTPVNPSRGPQKPVQVLSEMCVGDPGAGGPGSGGATVRRTSFRDSVFHAVRSDSCGSDNPSESDSGLTKRRLGRLDGILTRPVDIPLYVRSGAKPDPTQIASVLRETDRVELRRHLLTSMAENSALRQQTEREQRVRQGLASQLDSAREENDELRFQLEERSIELEGTRARVRLLERMQSVLSSPASATYAVSAEAPQPTSSPILASAPEEQTVGHSSSTESAHDAEVPPPPQLRAEVSQVLPAPRVSTPTPTTEQPPAKVPVSPRRRPSKIPLGTKSYYAPKPPSAKLLASSTPTPHTSIASHTGSAAGSTLKRRSTSTPDSGAPSAASWRARRDSSGRTSAASTHHGSRESLSATSGARSRSTPAKSSDASLASANTSASSLNRRDLSKSRDSVHSSPGGRKLHAAQTRRGSAGAGGAAGTLKDDPTKGRTKLNFWTGWWKIGILDSPS